MNIAIIYRTVFGTSRQYAEWLHEAIPSSLYLMHQVNKEILRKYQIVIVCGGIYLGRLTFNGFLKKNQDQILNKHLLLLTVGAIRSMDKAWGDTFLTIPEPIRKIAKYYQLPGKLGKDRNLVVKKDNLHPIITDIENLQLEKIVLREVPHHEKGFRFNASYRVLRNAT